MKHILAAIAAAALAWPVMAQPANVDIGHTGIATIPLPPNTDHSGMAPVSIPPCRGLLSFNEDRGLQFRCNEFVGERPELSSDLWKAAELCQQYKHKPEWDNACSVIEGRLLEFVRGVAAGIKP